MIEYDKLETFDIECIKCKKSVTLRSWIDTKCPECGHKGSYPPIIEIHNLEPLAVDFIWEPLEGKVNG